jgi:predicted ABC-type ATPase
MFRRKGAEYFDPDEVAERVLAANPALRLEEANGAAWNEGRRLLERAIDKRRDFAFETTLGGRTIAALLEKALSVGIEVRVWYVGLSDPELHIARVRSRVERGGHDIPEEKIRERYDRSRWNLIRLLPRLTELLVYDNSKEADPHAGSAPELKLILHAIKGKIVASCDLTKAPDWAKPILMTAMKSSRKK